MENYVKTVFSKETATVPAVRNVPEQPARYFRRTKGYVTFRCRFSKKRTVGVLLPQPHAADAGFVVIHFYMNIHMIVGRDKRSIISFTYY